jgi:hypothetical protein
MSWDTKVKTIALDGTIGLAAAPGAALTVRQRHPFVSLRQGCMTRCEGF